MTGKNSALGDAAAWFDAILAGPLVIALCSIAIAVLGLAMFAGRIDVRRGAMVIAGCFVVLGSSTIAHGLIDRSTTSSALAGPLIAQPPPHEMQRQNNRKVDDPYAGASLAH